jgi:hypothetical protein
MFYGNGARDQAAFLNGIMRVAGQVVQFSFSLREQSRRNAAVSKPAKAAGGSGRAAILGAWDGFERLHFNSAIWNGFTWLAVGSTVECRRPYHCCAPLAEAVAFPLSCGAGAGSKVIAQ